MLYIYNGPALGAEGLEGGAGRAEEQAAARLRERGWGAGRDEELEGAQSQTIIHYNIIILIMHYLICTY